MLGCAVLVQLHEAKSWLGLLLFEKEQERSALGEMKEKVCSFKPAGIKKRAEAPDAPVWTRLKGCFTP